MTDVVLLSMELLAQDGPRQTGPDFGKASPVGLIIIVLLLIAVFFLVWSMNRHLRKLPKSFDNGSDGDNDSDGDGGGAELGADPDLATENPAGGSTPESR